MLTGRVKAFSRQMGRGHAVTPGGKRIIFYDDGRKVYTKANAGLNNGNGIEVHGRGRFVDDRDPRKGDTLLFERVKRTRSGYKGRSWIIKVRTGNTVTCSIADAIA